jgi:hypothetical protein
MGRKKGSKNRSPIEIAASKINVERAREVRAKAQAVKRAEAKASILACKGFDMKKKARQLAKTITLLVKDKARVVRALMTMMIYEERLPIGNLGNGYFIIMNRAELEAVINFLERKIRGIQYRIDALRANFRAYHHRGAIRLTPLPIPKEEEEYRIPKIIQ